MAHAQVQRVAEPLLVVRPHVEGDRERAVGRDARAQGVEAELADRDAHPARALVAQAQDPLAVGHHDHRGVRDPGVRQDRLDAVPVLVGDVQAAAAPVDVVILLARLADDRRVDDRHHLVDVLEGQAVEERLVAVLQARQVDELLEVARLRLEVLVGPVHLLANGADGRRNQAAEVELVALPLRERGALVGERVQQQRPSPLGHGHVQLAGRRVDLDAEAQSGWRRSGRGQLSDSCAHGEASCHGARRERPSSSCPRTAPAAGARHSSGRTLHLPLVQSSRRPVPGRPGGRDPH